MKRTVTTTTTEESEEEVTICDGCGREADGDTLVPRDRIEAHLKRTEDRLLASLDAIDAPDLPEPLYEDHREPVKGQDGQITAPRSVTMTATIPSGFGGSGRKKVINRHFDGIDVEEKQLIEKAEELAEERDALEAALRTAVSEIQRVAQVPEFYEPLHLCRRCEELWFGWVDEE